MEQRSEEWYEARKGRITASNFDQIITRLGKKSASIHGAIAVVMAQRLTGKYDLAEVDGKEPPRVYYMERGTSLEDQAREAYELETLTKVEEVGFIPYLEHFGCSPDGLVGSDGMIEIKCQGAKEHMLALRNGWNQKYKPQIQGSLYMTCRKWCDFVSYHPAFGLDLIIDRVHRDDEYIFKIHEIMQEIEQMIGDWVGDRAFDWAMDREKQ